MGAPKDITVEEFLAVVAYFNTARSIMDASVELGMSFSRLREVLDQIGDYEQPGSYGLAAVRLIEEPGMLVRLQPAAELLRQPLALTALEATTLLLVTESIEHSASATEAETARAAATKLRSALRETAALVDAAVDSDLADYRCASAVQQALRQRKVLRVSYSNAAGEHSHRELDVLATMRVEQHSYIRAIDRADPNQTVKSFRADRIVAAEVTETAARYFPAVTVDPRDPHSFGADKDESRWARVRIAAADTWIADYEPVYFIESEDAADTPEPPEGEAETGKSFAADIPASNMAATVAFVLRRAPGVSVVKPVELREAVVKCARTALAEYARDS